MATVRVLDEKGAADIQIEDQVPARNCGHLNDKTLAVRWRRSPLMWRRRDAAANEGLRSQQPGKKGSSAIAVSAETTPIAPFYATEVLAASDFR